MTEIVEIYYGLQNVEQRSRPADKTKSHGRLAPPF